MEADSFAVARSRLLSAGIEFIYPESQGAAGRICSTSERLTEMIIEIDVAG